MGVLNFLLLPAEAQPSIHRIGVDPSRNQRSSIPTARPASSKSTARRRAATAALTLEAKLAGQKQIKALEAQCKQKRRSLFDAQDQMDKQRTELIAQIEGKLVQKCTLRKAFTVRWALTLMF